MLALQDSGGLDADDLAKALLPQERFEMVPSGDLLPETLAQPTLAAQQPTSVEAKAIKSLVTLFDGAKTFGSLITVPDAVMKCLPLLDALLTRLLSDRQLAMATNVRDWLLSHLPRTPAALQDAIARLDHAGLAARRPITRAMAQSVLSIDNPDENIVLDASASFPAARLL